MKLIYVVSLVPEVIITYLRIHKDMEDKIQTLAIRYARSVNTQTGFSLAQLPEVQSESS